MTKIPQDRETTLLCRIAGRISLLFLPTQDESVRRNSGTCRAFTLIETIIYSAIFSILMTGIVSSVFMLFESLDRNQTKAMLQEEKEYLIGKINWAMSGMQDIVIPGANTAATTLQLVKYEGTSVSIALAGSAMTIATSSSAVILNNSNVTVTNLLFIHKISSPNSVQSVEAGFTISSRTPAGSTITQTASTTRYVRK